MSRTKSPDRKRGLVDPPAVDSTEVNTRQTALPLRSSCGIGCPRYGSLWMLTGTYMWFSIACLAGLLLHWYCGSADCSRKGRSYRLLLSQSINNAWNMCSEQQVPENLQHHYYLSLSKVMHQHDGSLIGKDVSSPYHCSLIQRKCYRQQLFALRIIWDFRDFAIALGRCGPCLCIAVVSQCWIVHRSALYRCPASATAFAIWPNFQYQKRRLLLD